LAQYRFVTKWLLKGTTPENAWEVLKDSNYGDWWHGVTVHVLEPGDEHGLGELRESLFKTKLPYTLSFKSRVSTLERPSVIEMQAYGELEGTGRYDIRQTNDETEILYTWDVRTTKSWMNLMAPLMRPMFEWNHGQVMHEGAIGLAKRLNAVLIHG
jgi:hypothetical protein